MLHQVSGRAGRAERPGRVLIQTTDPSHPVLVAMASGDRDAFYAAEWAKRESAALPPFARLAAVILASRNEQAVNKFADELAGLAPEARGVQVWGPAPAPLAMLRGRHRQRLLVHAQRTVELQAILREWLGSLNFPRGVRIGVDVDPYSFM